MKYVALLRGINVGGNNMIKMEALRSTFSLLGFENVKSYINSGNIIFELGKADGELARVIHDAIYNEFGFDISVMVRSIAEIEQIIANNPFEGQFENDKDLHVFFLDSVLNAEQTSFLFAQGDESEMYHIHGRHILCHLKKSILESAVGKGFIDKKLKVPATARNWRTVKKIAEI